MTKKNQETKALAVTNQDNTQVALHALSEEDLNSWVDSQADSADIIIPKLILMQSNSELVADGLAGIGDFLRSTDKKVLGKKLKIIPFHKSVTWVELKLDGGKYKWQREIPFDEFNATMPWEYVDDTNTPCKRQKAFNFYVMLAEPAEDDSELPIIKVQLKSGSVKAGKTLADYFAKIPVLNINRKAQGKTPLVPASYVWELGVEVIKGENVYQAFTVTQVGPTPSNLLMECLTWFKTIQNGKNVKEHVVEDTEA